MNSRRVENIVHDEVHGCTYIVVADRTLTDGELFSAIRVALLRREGKRLNKGETLVINMRSSPD